MITLSSLPRAIIHVDCDAFFTSVEQSLNPELRNKPVITGKERGIAASMSYEAKAKGVTRGMRLHDIKRICPDCVLLPNDYESYSLVSKRLYGIIRRFTPDVEEYSIDEAFAELTGLRRIYRTSYENIALKIKQTIQSELGFTVSVGLSLTKSLAKICSKQNKPDGFTCVKGYELHDFLKNIPTERVCGFGPSSTALLKKNRIYSIFDFVNRPEIFAKKLFGKIGIELWNELRGTLIHPVNMEAKKDQVTLSKVKTFTPPTNDKAFVRAQLLRNVESAFIKLRRHHLRTKEIFILLRNHEYRGMSLGAELTRETSSTMEVVSMISQLFEKLFCSNQKYRQSGIVLCNLKADKDTQYDLFEDPCQIQSLKSLSQCTDEINNRFGKHAIHLGSTHYLTKFAQHIGKRGDFAQRKKNLLKGENFRQRINIPLWNIQMK